MGASQNRKQRREYELYLKKTDPKKYKEWKSGVSERGKQYHQAVEESARAAQNEFLEEKQRNMILDLRNRGYSDAQIDEYMAKWVESINA